MILYVDETENEEYFIVAGLLLNSSLEANTIYTGFRNNIKGFKISKKLKSIVYSEFKSKYLDTMFQRIKHKMLDEMNLKEHKILYSAYIKKNSVLKQSEKEKIYIHLLDSIVKNIDDQIEIVFDFFKIPRFEEKIIKTIKENGNAISIKPTDSQQDPGLKLIDNICGVIRLKLSNIDVNDFYSKIESNIKKPIIINN